MPTAPITMKKETPGGGSFRGALWALHPAFRIFTARLRDGLALAISWCQQCSRACYALLYKSDGAIITPGLPAVQAMGNAATDWVLLDAPGQQEVWRYYDPGLPVLALPQQRPPNPQQTLATLPSQGDSGSPSDFYSSGPPRKRIHNGSSSSGWIKSAF